jgi:hypothetical protein
MAERNASLIRTLMAKPMNPCGPPSRFSSDNQARKSLRLCLAGLRIGEFDPIAQAAELADHFGSALLLRLFGDGGAPFFVADSLVQDQPDQPTLSMGNGPDGLVMSQARD